MLATRVRLTVMPDDELGPKSPSLQPPRMGALDRLFGRSADVVGPTGSDSSGQVDEADARPLFADEVEDAVGDESADPGVPAEDYEPRSSREPLITGMLAAVLTGALVGLLLVLMTGLGYRICDAAKGTSSCGGPGLILLVAILALGVYAGAFLLRLGHVPDAMSTSFLAVGVVSVVTLLFLVDSIDAWWMAIALPILGMASYALSHWVTAGLIPSAGRLTG